MVPLKTAIQKNHKQAEQMPFNQKMFKGQLTHEQYYTYLKQLLLIFTELEKYPLPYDGLNRVNFIKKDLSEFDELAKLPVIETTQHYLNYLSTLSQEQQLPHVYLHYMALIFGGQIMKQRVPGSANLYMFDDKDEATSSIRKIQKDEWAEEVNKGLEYFIDILDELHYIFRLNS